MEAVPAGFFYAPDLKIRTVIARGFGFPGNGCDRNRGDVHYDRGFVCLAFFLFRLIHNDYVILEKLGFDYAIVTFRVPFSLSSVSEPPSQDSDVISFEPDCQLHVSVFPSMTHSPFSTE